MERIHNQFIPFLIIFAMAATPISNGIQTGAVTVTLSSAALVLAALLTAYTRLARGLPLFPFRVFAQPAFVATIVYFAIGLWSGTFAEDKVVFYKEIVQRTTIIWLPFYCVSMGLRKIDHAKTMFLVYLPICASVALISTGAAFSSKFAEPVYVLGLHKNMTASLCATMAIIVIAHLLTSKRPTIKLPVIKLPIKNRLLFVSLLVLAVFGIIAAQGRAGLLEVLVATYVMLIAKRAKPKTLIKISVICIVAGLVIYKFLPEQAIEHVVSTKQHSANAIRIEIWTEMGRNFMKNPWLAVGWGNPYVSETGWVYYDLCCVLLFDWMQMGIVGAIALLVMIVSSVWLGLWTARRVNLNSAEGFVILSATGIVAAKFAHGMLDTFWIARGANLHTWMAIGTCLFVRLWLQQNGGKARSNAMRQAEQKLQRPLSTVSKA